MKCPHCKTGIHPKFQVYNFETDNNGTWSLMSVLCPECNLFSFTLHSKKIVRTPHTMSKAENKEYLVWPKGIKRDPVPKEVPKDIVEDYNEACLVLSDSAKASAALSRRCLQHLLRDYAKIRDKTGKDTNIKKDNLFNEIQQILDQGHLPSYLSQDLDSIRSIGNFAAHPIKSTSSGEIIDIEPGEAEWNLDVLESLFDFYFVQAEKSRKKRDALNQKLADARKPEIQQPKTS